MERAYRTFGAGSLQQAYKESVDQWIGAIREEEDLATPDHSIVAWERWSKPALRRKPLKSSRPPPKKLTRPDSGCSIIRFSCQPEH